MPDRHGDATLFELLPIGAYRSSVQGRQLRANAALVRMNGYQTEDELLEAVGDIGAEWYVDQAQRKRFAQALLHGGQVRDFVSEVHRHRTRERIWVRENAHVVRDAAGQPLYYEGTVEDITDFRAAQQALLTSERRFRALTERSLVLTVICDAQGELSYVSPASRTMLGVEPAALLHTGIFEHVHPDETATAFEAMAAVMADAADAQPSIFRVRHADGSWRHLAMSSNNCLDDPAVNGVVLNLSDVSDRVAAEEALRVLNADLEQRVRTRTHELERARDQAQAANRAKSVFLSRMSHELRTPLNAILGFGQLLQTDAEASLDGTQRAYLREMLRAGDSLLSLIDTLLDLASQADDGSGTSP